MTGMPAWRSVLNDEQIWDVVAYLRRMSNQPRTKGPVQASGGSSDPDYRQIALQIVDDEGCRDCHTINGEGATIGPNLSDEWARGRSDQWLRGHFRDPEAYSPGTLMPSFKDLNDQQLNALIRFLQDPAK